VSESKSPRFTCPGEDRTDLTIDVQAWCAMQGGGVVGPSVLGGGHRPTKAVTATCPVGHVTVFECPVDWIWEAAE
jgi:hypothetical protein